MSLSEVADLYIILRAVTKPFSDAMAKAGAEGEATGAKIGGSIGRVSPVLMGITAATGLAAVASVKWATDFETQYTRLYTAAGASKDAVLANRDAILKLGTQTGYTGTQIAEALYHPVSAGMDLKTALDAVRASAEEARISGANLDDTTYALSSIMKAFNINGKGAADTMAQLNAIVGDGDMRFQDFNGSIKNWAPTAATMGISIQSMGSALAYLTDRGSQATDAATRVTMGLVMMATPSAQAAKLLEGLGVASGDVKASTSAMSEALKKAHVTQNDLAKDLQKPDGIYVALTHLKTALKDAGVSGTEADSTLAKIFGGGRSDKAILSLMSNLDGLKQKYDQIGKDSSGKKFQQDWEEAQKTTAVQFDKLKAQVINLGIQFGSVLLPPLKTVLKYITDGIVWITQHREAMYALAAVLSGVVVGALTAVTVQLYLMGKAALTNPLVDIAAALALAAVLIMTHWAQVKRFFEELFSWIYDHREVILMVLGAMFPLLTAIGVAAYEVITHWKQIWAFLKGLASDIKGWALEVARFFVHIWDDVSKWAKEGWDKATKVAKDAWGDLEKGWNETVKFLERIWNDTGGKLVHEISKDWNSATSAISGEWDHIVEDLSSIWDSLKTIWDATGGQTVHTISEGMDWIGKVISGKWNEIKEFFKGIWEAIWTVIRAWLDMIKTLIKVAWDTVKGVTKLVWDFIKDIIKLAWDVIYGSIKTALDLIMGILTETWDGIKGTVKIAWDIIVGLINTPLDFIKNLLKLFADIFSGHWSQLWTDVKKIAHDLWNDIWGTIKKVFDDIIKSAGQAGKDLIHGFWQALHDGLATIFGGMHDLWKLVTDYFKDALHWLYQAGKDLIQGLINGISDMANNAGQAIQDIGASIMGGLGMFKFGSPSRLMHQYGTWIGQGLIDGINSMSDKAGASMADLAGNVNAGFEVSGPSGAAFNGGMVTNRGALAPNTINIYVQGSVLSNRDLRDVVQEQMLQLGARYSTSYTPYKR